MEDSRNEGGFSPLSPFPPSMIHKLEYYSVRGKALIWLESFLNNQIQQVIVEAEFSIPCEVLSGVPQDSVLGPVLIYFVLDLAT